MKLITPLIALLGLVPAAQAATAWEGLVTINVTGPGMLSQFVNYSTHNGIVRVDLLGGDNGSRLVDSVKKEVIIIAPEGKTYARLPFAPAPAIDPTAQVEKLALTDPIQGHPTSHYTVKAGGMRAEVWLADDMPAEFWRLTDGAPWGMALVGKNGLLLRAIIRDANGREIMRMNPETVRPMRQMAADFAPPPGAKEVAITAQAPVFSMPVPPAKIEDQVPAPRPPAPSNGRRR
jgi:hypothetical protein